MALSTGTSQGKRLSSEGLTVEALPVLSGSFIAGCVTAGFFCPGFFLNLTLWSLLVCLPCGLAEPVD